MRDAVKNVSPPLILGDLPRMSNLCPRQHGVKRGRLYEGKEGKKVDVRVPDPIFLIVPEWGLPVYLDLKLELGFEI